MLLPLGERRSGSSRSTAMKSPFRKGVMLMSTRTWEPSLRVTRHSWWTASFWKLPKSLMGRKRLASSPVSASLDTRNISHNFRFTSRMTPSADRAIRAPSDISPISEASGIRVCLETSGGVSLVAMSNNSGEPFKVT